MQTKKQIGYFWDDPWEFMRDKLRRLYMREVFE